MRILSPHTGDSARGALAHSRWHVYLRRTDQHNPSLTRREFRHQQASEAAKQVTEGQQVRQGQETAEEQQAIENIRMGIGEKEAAVMERLNPEFAGEQVVNAGFEEEKRRIAARELSLEEQRAGWFQRRFLAARGFFQDIRGVFTGRRRDEIGMRVTEIFGAGETMQQNRIFVAQQLWDTLNGAQRLAVQTRLVALGQALPPPPPLPIGVNPQVFQLSLATADQLENIRTTAVAAGIPVFQPAPRQRYSPATRAVPPLNRLDRLIETVRVAGAERGRRTADTVYETQKLQGFLDMLQTTHQDIFELITERILEENSLMDLEEDAEAIGLVAKLRDVYLSQGQAALRRDLGDILQDLPTYEEEVKEGQELSPEKRALDDIITKVGRLPTTRTELSTLYGQARAIGAARFDLDQRLAAARAANQATATAAGTGRGGGTINVDKSNEARIEEKINEKAEAANKIQEQVRKLELSYLNDMTTLLTAVNQRNAIPGQQGGNAPAPYTELRNLANVFLGQNQPGLNLSTNDQLFGESYEAASARWAGPPPVPRQRAPHNYAQGTFTHHIDTLFNEETLGSALQVIKDQYYDRFKPHRKIRPEELHMFMVRAELFRQGENNTATATARAMRAVRGEQTRIRNRNMYRLTNQELAEDLGTTVLGMRWLGRLSKWVKSKVSPEKMLTAQNAINRATIDREDKNLSAFYDMPPDITEDEFRKLVDVKGVPVESIMRYKLKLQKIMEQFQAQNPDFSIELYDRHGKILEQLIETVQMVEATMETDSVVRDAVSEGKEFEETFLATMRARRQERIDRLNKILEDIANKDPKWIRWLKKLGIKKDWTEDYGKARERMKKEKMTDGEWKELLTTENLIGVASAVGTAYALKENVDTVKKGLGTVWNRGIAPAGGKAYGAAETVASWGNRRILKPTASAAKKVVTFPFRLMGKIFRRAPKE